MPAPKSKRAAPVVPATLADRVRLLIGGPQHRGNARAAARDAKIPIATFFRILDGTVGKPRSDALEKLAKLYDVSTDWLLFGDGRGPKQSDNGLPSAELYEWDRVITELGVSRETAELLADLPMRQITLCYAYLPGDVQLIRSSERHKESPRLDEAKRLDVTACIAWLRGLIDTIGRDTARERLEAAADGLRMASLQALLTLYFRLDDRQKGDFIEQLRATGFDSVTQPKAENVTTIGAVERPVRAGRKAPARKKR